MITVACVEHGNYCGRGEEYVERLRSMVARHLRQPHRFVRHTPQLAGWWGKIELFQPGRFSGRVVYFDLDTVIIGPLDDLVAATGIIHLRDWGWCNRVYGSGLMIWDAGEHESVWARFTPEVMARCIGDQDWITECGPWPALPASVRSYRYHCQKKGPPPGTSVVCFHGYPKPHDFSDGWVADAWR